MHFSDNFAEQYYTGEEGTMIFSGTFLSVSNSCFYRNRANTAGAININSGIILELLSFNFDTNIATKHGAVKAYSLVIFTMFDTNFTTNWTGAMMIRKTHIMILRNCFFYNNTSKKLSGANCVFRNNSAETGGAILFETYEDYYSANSFSCIEFFDRVDAIIGEVNAAL